MQLSLGKTRCELVQGRAQSLLGQDQEATRDADVGSPGATVGKGRTLRRVICSARLEMMADG